MLEPLFAKVSFNWNYVTTKNFKLKKFICNCSYIIVANKIFRNVWHLFCSAENEIWEIYGNDYNEIVEEKKKKRIYKNRVSILYASNGLSSRIHTRQTRFTKRLNNLILIHFAHYHTRATSFLRDASCA